MNIIIKIKRITNIKIIIIIKKIIKIKKKIKIKKINLIQMNKIFKKIILKWRLNKTNN